MSKDRIDVDADLWNKQKKELKKNKVVGLTGALIGFLGFSYGLLMTHIPKIITLPPVTKIQKVVEYKPYEGLDPDYLAGAIRDFKESHYLSSAHPSSEGDVPKPHYTGFGGCSYCAEDYDKQYPLNVRIEVRRRLGYLK